MRYLDANTYLADSWKLAAAIRKSGWKPDCMIALWRGGTPVGIAVHEFFKATGWDVGHVPLKCSSYTGIGQTAGNVVFTHGDAVFGDIKPGERVLVVDDVFDTGHTAVAIEKRLAARGAEMRLACVYWKSVNNATSMKPDYFVRDWGDEWIVFPHEIEGLSDEQLAAKDPDLARLVKSGYCT